MFVVTRVLSRQAYFCSDKRRVLSQQTRVCRDKSMLVANIIFLRQNKHMLVATVSRDKTFVARKMAPANDRRKLVCPALF